MEFLPDTFEGWLLVITSIVTACSAIAAVTPTPRDDRLFAGLYKVIDALALNLGKAKDRPDENVPTALQSRSTGMPRGPGAAFVLGTIMVLSMTGCAGFTPGGSVFFDTDGDPATPPVEITQEQRCAIYNQRIEEIDAKPVPLSDYDVNARRLNVKLRTWAFCPPRAGPESP